MKNKALALTLLAIFLSTPSHAGFFDKIIEDAVKEGINETLFGKKEQPAPPSYQAQPRKASDQTVMQVQACLNDKGYNAGPADGLIGKKTRNAIRSFEADNNLPQTGVASQDIRERACSGNYASSTATTSKQALSSSTASKNTKKVKSESEMTPKDIEALQKCLAGLNLYSGKITGTVNQETREAVTKLSEKAKNKNTGEKLMSSDEITSATSQVCLVTILQEKMGNMLGGQSGGTLYFTTNGVKVPLHWKDNYGMMSWTIKLRDRKKLPQRFSIPKVTYICKNGSSYNKKLGSFSTVVRQGVVEYLDSNACKGKQGVKSARLAN